MDTALRQALRAYTVKDDRLAWLSLGANLAVYFAATALAIAAVGAAISHRPAPTAALASAVAAH